MIYTYIDKCGSSVDLSLLVLRQEICPWKHRQDFCAGGMKSSKRVKRAQLKIMMCRLNSGNTKFEYETKEKGQESVTERGIRPAEDCSLELDPELAVF